MKTCSKCGIQKPFDEFAKDRTHADGMRCQCKECVRGKARDKYKTDEAYRERCIAHAAANRGGKDPVAHQAWLDRTRADRMARKAEYRRKAGAQTIDQIAADKAKRAAEKIRSKAERASRKPHNAHWRAWKLAKPGAYFVHRYRNDAAFNARQKIRARVRKMAAADSDIQRLMAVNVKAGRFAKGWSELLGYTMNELVAHLHRTLPRGAKWEQFLSGELHIDHITPRAAFDLTDIDEVRACWSLGNLRLLEAHKNRAKAAHIEVLL
jgi:hypothetical protein